MANPKVETALLQHRVEQVIAEHCIGWDETRQSCRDDREG